MTPTSRGIHLKAKKAEDLVAKLERATAAMDAVMEKVQASTSPSVHTPMMQDAGATVGSPSSANDDVREMIYVLQQQQPRANPHLTPHVEHPTLLAHGSDASAGTSGDSGATTSTTTTGSHEHVHQLQQQWQQAWAQYYQMYPHYMMQGYNPAYVPSPLQQAHAPPEHNPTAHAGGEPRLDPRARSYAPERSEQQSRYATGANAIPLSPRRESMDVQGQGEERVRALHDEIERLRAQLTQQRFGGSDGFGGRSWNAMPKVLMPEKYEGAPDGLASFMDDLEQWFMHYPNLSEPEKVTYSASLLTGAAKAWFDQRRREAKARGTVVFETLHDLQSALRAHFLDAGRWARSRAKLVKLRQTRDIHEYNKEFTMILTDIPDITASEKSYHYVTGLRRAVRRQVRLSKEWIALNEHPKAATDDMFIALKNKANEMSEDVDDYYTRPEYTHEPTGYSVRKRKADAVNNLRAIISKHPPDKRRRLRAERRCYICESKDHLARDCPTAEGRKWKSSVTHLYEGWDPEDLEYVFTMTAAPDEPEHSPDAPDGDTVNLLSKENDVTAEDFASDSE